MGKAIVVVRTRPVSVETEDEYNDWYTNQHLEDIVAIPGFASAKRYVLHDAGANDGSPPNEFKYLAIYELDTDDVAGAAQALKDAVSAGMQLSPALDTDKMLADYFVPIAGAERPAS